MNRQIKIIRKFLKNREKNYSSPMPSSWITKNSAQSQSPIFSERKMKNGGHSSTLCNFTIQILENFFNNSQMSKSEKYFQLDVERNY